MSIEQLVLLPVDEKKWMRKTIEKSSIVRIVPAIPYVDFVDKKPYNFVHIVHDCIWGEFKASEPMQNE